MNGAFTIERLRCARCGEDLPVMGEIVTFRCGVCGTCWLAGEEGLRRLAVYRASVPGGAVDRAVYLPFWTVPVDTGGLERSFEERMSSLSGGISGTVPSSAEIGRLLEEIVPGGEYNVYVPCFPSPDPMACLKAGRLMTHARPSFHAEMDDSPGASPACTLLPGEALTVIDYIFYSTLPPHVRGCAALVEGIRLEASSAPVLVEFPFIRVRESLHSPIGDFHVPARLAGTA